MTQITPLTPAEEEMWRALMRILKVLPRHLETDLLRSTGLSSSEYTTLMNLSEAPDRSLRMADLADSTGYSASRTTRLVDELQARGLVTKRASTEDGRGNVARLTPQGMAKLKAAWPAHVASVRKRFFDHLDGAMLEDASRALVLVAAKLDDAPGTPLRSEGRSNPRRRPTTRRTVATPTS